MLLLNSGVCVHVVQLNESLLALQTLFTNVNGDDRSLAVVEDISTQLTHSKDDLQTMQQQLQCDGYHQDFIKTVDTLCSDGLNSLVTLFSGHLLGALLLLLLIPLSSILARQYDTKRGKLIVLNNDSVMSSSTPLLSTATSRSASWYDEQPGWCK